ncbi:hypothetical protein J2Z21_008836 [Streptomyces griseochromogenes]|uniref:Uncharacterized protein n=1 Tax=Streptomyces griseochromogenes TaxID=68214 RepID=A0ABS4M828_9ACTN|nr:hypothetical protein [Streptomyces griseochromogenes]
MLVTARAIAEGDEAAWHQQWKALAERLRGVGLTALEAGYKVSARDALLRASDYFRTADCYLRENPAHDPEVAFPSGRVRETFAAAAAPLDHPAEPVSIPYEGTTLPGYLVQGGIGAGIPVVSATAGIELAGQLGLSGQLTASVHVLWTRSRGLVPDAEAALKVQRKVLGLQSSRPPRAAERRRVRQTFHRGVGAATGWPYREGGWCPRQRGRPSRPRCGRVR